MREEFKIIIGVLILSVIMGLIMATASKSATVGNCKSLQTLYGDVVELEKGWLTAQCTVGDYRIDGASTNDHLYIREYLK